MEGLFLMFKNWSKHDMFTSTTILLKSLFVHQKLLTEISSRTVEKYGGSLKTQVRRAAL